MTNDRRYALGILAFAVLLAALYLNRLYNDHVFRVRYGLEDLRDGLCRRAECGLFNRGRSLASSREYENGRSCPPEPDALRQGCLSEIGERLSDYDPVEQD